MRRSPSTFFDRAEAAASNRPEAQINIPDIFDNSTILPQRHLFCSQVIAVSLTSWGCLYLTATAQNRAAQMSLDGVIERQSMATSCILEHLAQHSISSQIMEW
jgi:hypothetical protein